MKRISITVILVILAFLGYRFVSNQNAQNTSVAPSPSLSPSPTTTAEWKTYTNENLGITFNYPSDWVITPKQVREDYLSASITSPNGFAIDITAGPPGVGGRCDDDPNKNLGSEAITVFGEEMNLFYFGDKEKDTISYAYIIKEDSPCPNIAYFDIPGEMTGTLGEKYYRLGSVKMYYPNQPSVALSTFTSSDLELAKQMISTAKVTRL